jgi:hypothetical protein
MKVMCIDGTPSKNSNVIDIPFGRIVTVAGEAGFNQGEDHFFILEYPRSKSGKKAAYTKRRFAPLSEIDETELVEQRLITA